MDKNSPYPGRGTEKRFCRLDGTTDGRELRGVAIRYGIPSKVAGIGMESFASGCFGKVGKIVCNLQHDRGKPLARNVEGGGLALTDGAKQLDLRVDLPDTSHGRDAAELCKRGVLRGFSIEFRAQRENRRNGVRVIERADLLGVAIVDNPAHSGSVITDQRADDQPAASSGMRFWL